MDELHELLSLLDKASGPKPEASEDYAELLEPYLQAFEPGPVPWQDPDHDWPFSTRALVFLGSCWIGFLVTLGVINNLTGP